MAILKLGSEISKMCSKTFSFIKSNKLLSASLLLLGGSAVSFADGGVTSMTAMNTQINSVFQLGARTLTNVGAISGLGLFFTGIFNVYTSHTKQQSGGKPLSHGLMMIGAGACLIGLPYMYGAVGKTVYGSSYGKIGKASIAGSSSIFGS